MNALIQTSFPPRCVWICEPLTEVVPDDEAPRLAAEVQAWCDDGFQGAWRLLRPLYDIELDPGTAETFRFSAHLTLVQFDDEADEMLFRLRWT